MSLRAHSAGQTHQPWRRRVAQRLVGVGLRHLGLRKHGHQHNHRTQQQHSAGKARPRPAAETGQPCSSRPGPRRQAGSCGCAPAPGSRLPESAAADPWAPATGPSAASDNCALRSDSHSRAHRRHTSRWAPICCISRPFNRPSRYSENLACIALQPFIAPPLQGAFQTP